VSGPVNLPNLDRVKTIPVTTAIEMSEAVMQNIVDQDVFIGVAAVADYRPAEIAEQKIKKNADELTLRLVKNPDIIATVAALPTRPFVVGFAAETQDILKNGKSKLQNKKLDLLFANMATDTFGQDEVQVTAIGKDLEQELPLANKNVAARQMLQLIAEQIKTDNK